MTIIPKELNGCLRRERLKTIYLENSGAEYHSINVKFSRVYVGEGKSTRGFVLDVSTDESDAKNRAVWKGEVDAVDGSTDEIIIDFEVKWFSLDEMAEALKCFNEISYKINFLKDNKLQDEVEYS